MNGSMDTRGLWLTTRHRQNHFDGEACLLVYDVDSFTDALISGDIKQVFEHRAGTANIFLIAPYLPAVACREALRAGSAILRAASYMAAKSGNLYLIELRKSTDGKNFLTTSCRLTSDPRTREALFDEPSPLEPSLREGWLFDLFDSNAGLVVAPTGVHFRKGSNKHSSKFLRAANALTSSAACGLLGFFALGVLGHIQPKRVLVDTAPLLSLASALMQIARAHGVLTSEVPARSFSSYGRHRHVGRLSGNDVLLISATTSGSLADALKEQGAQGSSIVTLYYLSAGSPRPENVLCDLTISGERSFGYQPVENYTAVDCPLCRSGYIVAELEGDQFLLQQRQHRLLRLVRAMQTTETRETLADLKSSEAVDVVLRADSIQPQVIEVDPTKLLNSPTIRKDMIRLLRRYCPQPLALVVLVSITGQLVRTLFDDAGLTSVIGSTEVIDWSALAFHPMLSEGAGVLVVFGCLSSHTAARQINASLRSIVNAGNVAYLSALTLADTPEKYQDLRMFLAYGERGPDTFTFRDVRRLALPTSGGGCSPWADEADLLDRLADEADGGVFEARRTVLASARISRNAIFLDGKSGPLSIQRDFVFMDTTDGTEGISQADVFAVVSNLFATARSNGRDLSQKAAPNTVLELAQSVYGHVLLSPESFVTYNDAVLKACLLRAARPSELLYEVDPAFSDRMAEVVLAELAGWSVGTGDALPEMLLALATRRLRLRDIDRVGIRMKALTSNLSPFLKGVAASIPA